MVPQNSYKLVAVVSLTNTKDIIEPLEVDALELDIENMTLLFSLWHCLDLATACELVNAFILDKPG